MPAVKKEDIVLPPLDEIGLEELYREDAIYFLGLMAAQGLRNFGQVTFIMGADQKVCVANPVHVYLDSQAVTSDDSPAPPFKWVRPILGSGRPQYSAWKNGELWEIEFYTKEETLEDIDKALDEQH